MTTCNPGVICTHDGPCNEGCGGDHYLFEDGICLRCGQDDYPVIECPKCGREQADMDGFGFIACIPGCGHCRHVAAEKKEDGWCCSICGNRLPE